MLHATEIASGCCSPIVGSNTSPHKSQKERFPTILVCHRTTVAPNQSILRYVLGGWATPASKPPNIRSESRGRRSPRNGNRTATHSHQALGPDPLLLQLRRPPAPH